MMTLLACLGVWRFLRGGAPTPGAASSAAVEPDSPAPLAAGS